MPEQYSPSDFDQRPGTDFQDGGQIDFHVQSEHVASYEQGVAAARAAQLAERMKAHERPLMGHEQIRQVSEFLAQYRMEKIEDHHRSRGNPDDYELIT